MKIYKYFSPSVFDIVFEREGFCGLKCSFPKDYNDPYELFLAVDLNQAPENLAVYREIIQEIPQLPTTCFSRSPTVAPMWAHYASNHSGFVLEFDVEALLKSFKEIDIRDVVYRTEPDPRLATEIQRVAVTRKPRHAVWLRQAVLASAYFSKYQDWSYEQECRLVDLHSYVENINGNDILFVPTECVTSFILGRNFAHEEVEKQMEVVSNFGFPIYKIVIGKSLPVPYLETPDHKAYLFEDGKITEAMAACAECNEPLLHAGDLCAWCSITENHADDAARGNPFRLLDQYGLLEDYFESVRKIERRHKK